MAGQTDRLLMSWQHFTDFELRKYDSITQLPLIIDKLLSNHIPKVLCNIDEIWWLQRT